MGKQCNKKYLTILSVLFVLLFALPDRPLAEGADNTIGVIMTGDLLYYQKIHEAFMEGMAARGFGPEKIEVFLQTPTPGALSWTNAARKYVAYDVDMIVCYGMPATIAVLKEKSGIPVVFAGVYYPHTLDLDTGNATGISSNVPEAMIIDRMKQISNFYELGVIYNQSEKDTTLQVNNITGLESKFLFHTTTFDIQGKRDVDKIANIEALLLTPGAAAMTHLKAILAVAHRQKLLTAATIGGTEEAGVILTVEADPEEQGKTAAAMAVKVLQGIEAEKIPVALPKKVNIIINLKEATKLGMKIPFRLLTSSTKLIQ